MTINTLPTNNSTFTSDLDTFLAEEDADRFRDMFIGFVVSGGTHGTIASLTDTPDALVAYPGGHYITESGSITYPDDATHIWVICHKDTTTAVSNWTRVVGTHYLFRNTGSGTKPALPVPETAILMKVTTASGSVTVVEDHRELNPVAELTSDIDVGLVINESGLATYDLRYESDLNTHMFFIDSGNNSVHIDNSLLTGAGDGDLVMANDNWIRFINVAGTTSANFGLQGDGADNLSFHVPATTDEYIINFAGVAEAILQNQNSGFGIRFLGESSSDHSAPSANDCVLYTTDTGGKTQLMARFATGAVQQIAVEP